MEVRFEFFSNCFFFFHVFGLGILDTVVKTHPSNTANLGIFAPNLVVCTAMSKQRYVLKKMVF